MTVIRWGILGASNFARNQMGRAIHAAEGATLAAIGTTSPAKADGFAGFAPGLRVHDSYQAVLDDPEIDAIYIPLPNHMHVDWTIKALAAGKHVLCEKPVAMNAAEIGQLIAARDSAGLLAAEAYMIVHHPQLQRARDIVQHGGIGKLRHVDTAFSFFNDDMGNIRNQQGAGGGALADIGVYAFGGARFVTGAEPQRIREARIDIENGVDTFAQVSADFENFTYAAMVSIRMFKRQEMTFHGEGGVLRLTCPFNPGVHDQAELHLETQEGRVTVERFPGVNQYVLQVEAFGDAVRNGTLYPCPLEFSQGTQVMIDMTLAAAGQALR